MTTSALPVARQAQQEAVCKRAMRWISNLELFDRGRAELCIIQTWYQPIALHCKNDTASSWGFWLFFQIYFIFLPGKSELSQHFSAQSRCPETLMWFPSETFPVLHSSLPIPAPTSGALGWVIPTLSPSHCKCTNTTTTKKKKSACPGCDHLSFR